MFSSCSTREESKECSWKKIQFSSNNHKNVKLLSKFWETLKVKVKLSWMKRIKSSVCDIQRPTVPIARQTLIASKDVSQFNTVVTGSTYYVTIISAACLSILKCSTICRFSILARSPFGTPASQVHIERCIAFPMSRYWNNCNWKLHKSHCYEIQRLSAQRKPRLVQKHHKSRLEK